MSSPDPAGLHSSMWRFADPEARYRIIHHYRPRVNTPRQRVSASAILSPHARREPIFRVVSEANGFIVVIECHDRQHGTERLLAHDAHFVIHIC